MNRCLSPQEQARIDAAKAQALKALSVPVLIAAGASLMLAVVLTVGRQSALELTKLPLLFGTTFLRDLAILLFCGTGWAATILVTEASRLARNAHDGTS